jgi:hypothetical protein
MVLLALAALSDDLVSLKKVFRETLRDWQVFSPLRAKPPHYLCKERTAVSFDAGSGGEFASDFLAHPPPLK